jgi:hypothetical protein
MKKSLVILALVAGCGASDHGGNNHAVTAAGRGRASVPAAAPPAPGRPSDAPGLAGLYQSGSASQPNQLCIADKGDSAQFGLTVWGPNMAACSGAGLAKVEGGKLTLTMTGDSACALTAEVKDGKVVLPGALPEGCAYYCGKGAALAGASFSLKQAGVAGAAKAKDPAGDPLCG